jgi:hypothetical protein
LPANALIPKEQKFFGSFLQKRTASCGGGPAVEIRLAMPTYDGCIGRILEPVVGRLPGAFAHPREGFVDALVMYLRFE